MSESWRSWVILVQGRHICRVRILATLATLATLLRFWSKVAKVAKLLGRGMLATLLFMFRQNPLPLSRHAVVIYVDIEFVFRAVESALGVTVLNRPADYVFREDRTV